VLCCVVLCCVVLWVANGVSVLVAQVFDCSEPPCLTGDEYLAQLNLDRISIEASAVILLAMIVIYRFLAYLALRFLHNGKSIRESLMT